MWVLAWSARQFTFVLKPSSDFASGKVNVTFRSSSKSVVLTTGGGMSFMRASSLFIFLFAASALVNSIHAPTLA